MSLRGKELTPLRGRKRDIFQCIHSRCIVNSRWKRVLRRALFIPFSLAGGLVLAVILTLSFVVEVYVSEVYDGAFKEYLVRWDTFSVDIGVYSHHVSFFPLSCLVEHLSPTFDRLDELRKPSNRTRF